MIGDVRVFSGYVWYAYPKEPRDKFALAKQRGEKCLISVSNFPEMKAFSNYNEDAVILVTDSDEPPKVDVFWEVIPCHLPDGFGGEVNGKVIRHMITTSSSPNYVFSVFAELTV